MGTGAIGGAIPAIEVEDAPETAGFSPFGRDDERTRNVTPEDVRPLAGHPQSPQVIVPVAVHG
jgi:hypothetical protein